MIGAVLELDGVRRTLRSFALDLDLRCEDWPLVILGPSGAGKTQFLRMLAGLERPDQGRILFDGTPWFEAGAERSALPAQNITRIRAQPAGFSN